MQLLVYPIPTKNATRRPHIQSECCGFSLLGFTQVKKIGYDDLKFRKLLYLCGVITIS